MVRLVIPLDGAFDLVNRWTRQRCPITSFTGIQTAPMFIEGPASRAAVLGIELYPAGAYALIGAPLTETTDQLIDLGDLVGAPAAEFAERCATASSGEARVRIAADWVSQRIARSPGLDPRVAVTLSRIERDFGALPIGTLHEAVGLSKKRLIAAFRQQVGVTPKTYARIVRFRRAMNLLGNGYPPASVAVIAGYYDQPHMNLEFRELAGVTPGRIPRHHPVTATAELFSKTRWDFVAYPLAQQRRIRDEHRARTATGSAVDADDAASLAGGDGAPGNSCRGQSGHR
jgi:AraC-like DNA-binding protein